MKKFAVLKLNSLVYDLQMAYGLMVFLQAVFSADGVVGEDTKDFIVLKNKKSAYVIEVDTESSPDINSYKYISFLGTLTNKPRISVSLFATKKMTEFYSESLIEMFSDFEFVEMLLRKFAYENIDAQEETALLEKKKVFSTLDPYGIKDKRSNNAALGYNCNVREPYENILLASIGSINFARLVKIRNSSGQEKERIIYLLNPEEMTMNTNEIASAQAHVPFECPAEFLRTYLSITQAQKLYDYNNYSVHNFKNVIFVAYKRTSNIRPYAVYNGFDFDFYRKLIEISPGFVTWAASIFRKAMIEFETGAKKNAVKISVPLGCFLETQDSTYLFQCIELLRQRNAYDNINEQVDFRKVMEAVDKESYSLANDEVVNKLGKCLKRKQYVSGAQTSMLRRKLGSVGERDGDKLMDILVLNLIENAELDDEEGSHIIKLAYEKPAVVAKSILFRSITSSKRNKA